MVYGIFEGVIKGQIEGWYDLFKYLSLLLYIIIFGIFITILYLKAKTGQYIAQTKELVSSKVTKITEKKEEIIDKVKERKEDLVEKVAEKKLQLIENVKEKKDEVVAKITEKMMLEDSTEQSAAMENRENKVEEVKGKIRGLLSKFKKDTKTDE